MLFKHSFPENFIYHHSSGRRTNWLPALIGAVGSIAAGGLSAAAQSRQNKQNVNIAKDVMDYQWNNYGSPQAQMAAYKAIGVNPFASQGLNPSQPQSQIPDQISPMSAGFGFLGQLVAPMQELAQSAMAYRLLQSQAKGQEITNSLNEFDLGEIKPNEVEQMKKNISLLDYELTHIKPYELKNLQSDLATKSFGRHLTRKQLELIAEQILKTKAETAGVSLDNIRRQIDNQWRQIQYDAGMPMAEYYATKHGAALAYRQAQRTYQDYNINRSNEAKSEWQQSVIKNLNQFREQIDKFDFEKDLNFVPEPLRKLAAPMIRAVFYMLLNQMSQGMTDPLGTVGDVMRFLPK